MKKITSNLSRDVSCSRYGVNIGVLVEQVKQWLNNDVEIVRDLHWLWVVELIMGFQDVVFLPY